MQRNCRGAIKSYKKPEVPEVIINNKRDISKMYFTSMFHPFSLTGDNFGVSVLWDSHQRRASVSHRTAVVPEITFCYFSQILLKLKGPVTV